MNPRNKYNIKAYGFPWMLHYTIYNIQYSKRLIILLPPQVDKKEEPGSGQRNVPNSMSRPVMGKIFKLPPKVESPNCHRYVKKHTPFGKETLELPVLNTSNHEHKESNCEQQQAREGI